jgi:hypothetical protein
MVAYFVRPMLTNHDTRRYYFPALTLKIIGAIALGFIYQFYYSGGDTFAYHTHGSRVLWDKLIEDPSIAIKAFFSHGTYGEGLWEISDEIWFWRDNNSFTIVQISAFFDLITFSSYSATAVLFAFISFLGLWFLFLAFYELFPHLHRWLAIACFFIPSVFFWGSGILKDTIIMACIGFATFQIKRIFIDKRISVIGLAILMASAVLAFSIKKYVLLCFIPAALFWVYAGNLYKMKSPALRFILLPVMLILTLFTGFYAIQKIGANDPRYALDKIAKTAQITAYDIRYWSGRDAGSGYSLGELDGSFSSIIKLGPQAVIVSLFRPYLWEVKNILMLLSSLEATVLLCFTLFLLFKRPLSFFRSLSDPNVLFCFIFSITFSFAVGVSTYNFGTLARYKIPMLPFFAMGLVLVRDKEVNKEAFLNEETIET